MASVNTMYCRGTDNVPFSVSNYNAASAAVGVYLKCDMNQVAVSTSPEDFVAPKDMFLYDLVAGAASGTIEIISNGKKTGIMLDYAAHQADSPGRPVLNIPFSKGTQVRFQVIAVLPA